MSITSNLTGNWGLPVLSLTVHSYFPVTCTFSVKNHPAIDQGAGSELKMVPGCCAVAANLTLVILTLHQSESAGHL